MCKHTTAPHHIGDVLKPHLSSTKTEGSPTSSYGMIAHHDVGTLSPDISFTNVEGGLVPSHDPSAYQPATSYVLNGTKHSFSTNHNIRNSILSSTLTNIKKDINVGQMPREDHMIHVILL